MLSKQKIRQKLARADFTYDVMFGLVMSQLEICRKFLKAVLRYFIKFSIYTVQLLTY